MRATFALTGLMPSLLLATPASAATAAQKMETCKYGADHDSLPAPSATPSSRNA